VKHALDLALHLFDDSFLDFGWPLGNHRVIILMYFHKFGDNN